MLKLKYFIICMVLAFPIASYSTCIKVTSTSSLSSEVIDAGYTAKSWLGGYAGYNGSLGLPSVVSLSTSTTMMPVGTLLASASTSFLTAASNVAFTANQILFRCALADAGSLYEMYSTNGDAIYAGEYESPDVESAYYTYVRGVGVRFTNNSTGKYFTNFWQKKEITSDDWVSDDTYIYIPASAFSDVTTELFRISVSTVYSINSSNYYYWAYTIENAQVAFKGPGLASNSLTDGMSALYYYGYADVWPGNFSLYGGTTIVRGALCLVKDYPSIVLIPTISTSSLNNGETSQSTFDISLSCEDAAISSVSQSTSSSANVAMGFLVNQSTAVTAATTLGLTSTSGLTHLLDTNYGSSGVASGVGIRIYDENGNALNLLSSKTATTGNAGGWYAFKDLTTSQDDSTDGLTTYTGNFTASLEALSGETVTAGTVNAQLQVVVSFQ